MSDKFYVETVTERVGQHVLASTIRPATQEDIDACRKLHEAGACPHNIVQDEAGWLYDYRSCGVCGAGLGTV